MALAQAIKNRQGLVAQTSLEEQAAMTGRASAPVSPLEAGVIGGNPDQAKMAGTPGQKTSAIRSAIQGQNDLATALRQGQGRTTASAQEKSQLAGAESLEKLGGLGDRVQSLAENMTQNVTAKEGDVSLQAISTDADITQLLNNLKVNPNDMVSLKQLNEKLGRSTPDTQLTGPELMEMYGEEPQQIAQAYANTVGNQLVTGALPLTEMGFKDAKELASVLGVDEKKLSGMSVPELLEHVNMAIDREHSEMGEIEARLNDPMVGPAERAEIRKELRAKGAVGIIAAETDIDKLADQIANADTINIFGKEMTVDQALSDETVSGIVATYLDGLDEQGNPITDEAKKFAADPNNADILKFIKDNKAVLDQSRQLIDDGQKQFAKIQVENKNLATSQDGTVTLDDAIMKDLFPTWGENTSGAYNIEQYPFLKMLRSGNLSKDQTNQLGMIAKKIKDGYPHMFGEFAKLDDITLKKLGVLGGPMDYQKFSDKLDEIDKYKTFVASGKTDDMAKIFGVDNFKDLKTLRTELLRGANFGNIDSSSLEKIPGLKEGNWTKVKEYMAAATPSKWAEIAKDMSLLKTSFTEAKSKAQFDVPVKGLERAFDNGPTISKKEWINIVDPMNGNGLKDLKKTSDFLLKNKDKFDNDAYETAVKDYTSLLNKKVNKSIIDSGLFKNSSDMKTFVSEAKKMQITYDPNNKDSTLAAQSKWEGVQNKIKDMLGKIAEVEVNDLNREHIDEMKNSLKGVLTRNALKAQEVAKATAVAPEPVEKEAPAQIASHEGEEITGYKNAMTGETISPEKYKEMFQTFTVGSLAIPTGDNNDAMNWSPVWTKKKAPVAQTLPDDFNDQFRGYTGQLNFGEGGRYEY